MTVKKVEKVMVVLAEKKVQTQMTNEKIEIERLYADRVGQEEVLSGEALLQGAMAALDAIYELEAVK